MATRTASAGLMSSQGTPDPPRWRVAGGAGRDPASGKRGVARVPVDAVVARLAPGRMSVMGRHHRPLRGDLVAGLLEQPRDLRGGAVQRCLRVLLAGGGLVDGDRDRVADLG